MILTKEQLKVDLLNILQRVLDRPFLLNSDENQIIKALQKVAVNNNEFIDALYVDLSLINKKDKEE